ncbi:hypothetical protein M422DRAFT_249996 [Sphaerobolus stellatus SS14]|nr:hypothetical protein M422DRAFT_249996 [Sphaerobolus stellatus SS14]
MALAIPLRIIMLLLSLFFNFTCASALPLFEIPFHFGAQRLSTHRRRMADPVAAYSARMAPEMQIVKASQTVSDSGYFLPSLFHNLPHVSHLTWLGYNAPKIRCTKHLQNWQNLISRRRLLFEIYLFIKLDFVTWTV